MSTRLFSFGVLVCVKSTNGSSFHRTKIQGPKEAESRNFLRCAPVGMALWALIGFLGRLFWGEIMRKRWFKLHDQILEASPRDNERSATSGSECDQASPIKRKGKPLGLKNAAVDKKSGPEERLTTIQDLDPHCLSQILDRLHDPPPYPMSRRWEKLEACSLVCRDWLDASNFCRKTVALQGPQAANLPRFLFRFPDIQGVEIEDVPEVAVHEDPPKTAPPGIPSSLADVPLELLVSGSRRLSILHLEQCSAVPTAGLAAVLNGCRDLRRLNLSFCGGFTGAVFEGVRCNLDSLGLYRSGELTNAGLIAAARACPSLRTLKIRRKLKWTRVDLSEGVGEFASFCPNLMVLHLEACGITDATLRSFAVGCPRLVDVRIYNEPVVTDAGVAALSFLPRLESLSLWDNHRLTQIPRSRLVDHLESSVGGSVIPSTALLSLRTQLQ